MGYNLPDGVTQDMIDAQFEPTEADLASMLPAEPPEGSAVRDKDRFVWVRVHGGWTVPGLLYPIEWARLVDGASPLHLLIDGPPIS